MDEHLAQVDGRVAAAAQAWMTDPRDAGVDRRLVAALEERQRYLHPQLDVASTRPDGAAATHDDRAGTGDREEQVDRDVDLSGPPVVAVDEDEVLDDLGAGRAPAPVGVDAAALVARLRPPAADPSPGQD